MTSALCRSALPVEPSKADARHVIEAVVVASRDVRDGIRRLLESDGDIRVVAMADTLRGSGYPRGDVIVIGPGVRLGPREWAELLDRGWSHVVLLAPLPGWRRSPAPVLQVPIELSGSLLRGAVREAVTTRDARCQPVGSEGF